MSVARCESFIKNNKITFKYYDGNEIKDRELYFMDINEHIQVYRMLNSLNLRKRYDKERYLAVFINPISGLKKSKQYYDTILKPMLDYAGIKHDIFVTDSSHYVSDFVANLNPDQMIYTDFVVISGDGIFNQVYNAFSVHKDKDKLMNIPIGFVPGGSANCISWALGGTNPYYATSLILKGNVVKSDVFEVTLDNQEKVYGTGLAYGIASVVIENDQRKLFDRHRYLVISLYKWVFSLHLPTFPIDIIFKVPSTTNIENEEWVKYDKNEVYFLSVLTHEVKSTLTKAVLLPITKINDGKMIVHLMDKWRKIDAAMYFFKFFVNKHLFQNKIKTFEASEIKLAFPEKRQLTVDGEAYNTKHLNIKLLPSFANFIGQVDEFTEQEQQLKQDLNIV